jgi:hypothetical protein
VIEVDLGALYGDENRRLRAAFFVSVLAHLGMLWQWSMSPVPSQPVSHGSLEVSFSKAAVASKLQAEAEPGVVQSQPVLVVKPPVESNFVATVKPLPPRPTPVAAEPEKTVSQADATPQIEAPAPIKVRRPVLRSGEADVVMVVDAKGRVGVIYWNRLPALTDEQMQLVELRIRQRRFEEGKRGGAVSEIINVFEILRAPAVSASDEAGEAGK